MDMFGVECTTFKILVCKSDQLTAGTGIWSCFVTSNAVLIPPERYAAPIIASVTSAIVYLGRRVRECLIVTCCVRTLSANQ